MTGTKKRAAKAGPDPIFAAIEAHRQAQEEFTARNAEANKLEEEWYQSLSSTPKDELVEAARKVEMQAADKSHAVAAVLATVEPTTLAGICALLTYFADVEVIDRGLCWPDRVADDNDPAVSKRNGATVGYFVARNVARALARVS